MAAVTLVGDLIADDTRLAAVEGDGRPYPNSSVGIYPARTQLLPNAGFEQDTRYANAAFASISRQSVNKHFGTFAGRATITSSGQTAYIQIQGQPDSTPLAGYYTFSVNIYGAGSLIGTTAAVYMFESGGAIGGNVLGTKTVAKTIATGWWNAGDELVVTAVPTQVDRTVIYGRIQLIGLAAGTIIDFECSLFHSPIPFPFIEASEAQVEYNPAVNLVTNGDFETNITGWSGGSTTRTQSVEQAKTGTGSLKAVSTANGQVFVQGQYVAAPVPQLSYGCAGWMYATPGIVGKTVSLNLNESGGATGATLVGGSGSRILEPGWNYLFGAGTVVQPDRTSLIPIFFLNGAVVSDTFYVDAVRIGANYVAPTPVIVSKTAGQIRIPVTGLSSRQGWIALSVRPNWSTTDGAGRYRPALPMTLFQWQDDADNGIRLTFDGGLLTIEREASGGAETAQTPWAATKNTIATLVASWDANGVYVSVDGRPLVGRFETFVTDTFTRADTAAGLGTTETGGKTWLPSGGSPPKITSNRYTPHASTNGTGYAYLNLGEVPARFGGVVSYVDGGGGGSGNHTLACDTAAMNLATLLHLFLNRTSANYQWRDAGGAFNDYQGITTVSTIPTDGSPVATMLTMQDDTLAITQGGESYAFKHESIARLASQYVFWEVGRSNGASGLSSRWDSIQVDRYGAWAALSANIPVLSATVAEIGSNGIDGHVCGDVLWVMAGTGVLTDADVAALDAATPDPDAGTVQGSAKPILVWPAETTALWGYHRPAVSIATRRAPITGWDRRV